MSTAEIILAILTLLLGGGNILQLLQIRALKRKSNAEASQEEIRSLSMIIDKNREEITRLTTSYGELQEKYFKLAEEVQDLRARVNKQRTTTKKSNTK